MTAPIPRPTPVAHTTTDEVWSITDEEGNEIALSQHGWNVSTKGGSRYDLPARRGDNRRYPYRPGARHKKNKMPDERDITLDMWVNGTNPGTGATVGDPTLQWNDSWNFIRHLVWRPNGAQFLLTRRWWLTIDGEAVIHKASTLVEVVDSMTPTMRSQNSSTFQMQLLMTSPFFYGDWIETTIHQGQTVEIFNPGDDVAMYENFVITFNPTLVTPKLTNITSTPNKWLRFDGNVFNVTTFDVPEFLVNDTVNSNLLEYVVSSGSRFWFGLDKGLNRVTLESDSASPATGTCTIAFRAPFV